MFDRTKGYYISLHDDNNFAVHYTTDMYG